MFCEECNMVLHDGEVSWVTIYSEEIPFCPIHRENLTEVG
jgi:hypothetical protein